jgi:hypothetical protein
MDQNNVEQNNVDKIKLEIKLNFINKALDNGWTVRKLNGYNTYEFIKNYASFCDSNRSSRRSVSNPVFRTKSLVF